MHNNKLNPEIFKLHERVAAARMGEMGGIPLLYKKFLKALALH